MGRSYNTNRYLSDQYIVGCNTKHLSGFRLLKKCILFPKRIFRNETHVSACQLLTLSVQGVITGKAKNDETRDMAKLLLDYEL